MSKTNENANPTTFQSTSDADATAVRLLQELRPLWQEHRERGLEIRHQMGRQLNMRLGSLGLRREYIRHVIRTIAADLRVETREIAKMRQFDDMFESVRQMHELHPEDQTWSDVARLLADRPGNGADASQNETAARQLARFENQLRSMLSSVENGCDSLSAGRRMALAEEIARFASAAVELLGYQLQIDLTGTESS